MNNAVFGKTMENIRTCRDFKLVTTNKRRNYLVSELDYHATVFFWKFISKRNEKKIKAKINKLVYLGLSILEISKTLVYKFWYDYIKQSISICKAMLHGYR